MAVRLGRDARRWPKHRWRARVNGLATSAAISLGEIGQLRIVARGDHLDVVLAQVKEDAARPTCTRLAQSRPGSTSSGFSELYFPNAFSELAISKM